MTDIDKLLEERGKIHGDAETTHEVAYKLMKICLDELPDTNLKSTISQAGLGMLFLIFVKISRGLQNSSHADHWDDIKGYAELIKRVECPTE